MSSLDREEPVAANGLLPVRPPGDPTPGAGATFTPLQPINSYPNRPQ